MTQVITIPSVLEESHKLRVSQGLAVMFAMLTDPVNRRELKRRVHNRIDVWERAYA